MSSVFLLFPQKYWVSAPFITPESTWKKIDTFKNKGRGLENPALAKIPKKLASGMRIRIDSKFSRPLSCEERVLRLLLGLILVILTLGLVLIYKPIRQLFYKDHISIKLVKLLWPEDPEDGEGIQVRKKLFH